METKGKLVSDVWGLPAAWMDLRSSVGVSQIQASRGFAKEDEKFSEIPVDSI